MRTQWGDNGDIVLMGHTGGLERIHRIPAVCVCVVIHLIFFDSRTLAIFRLNPIFGSNDHPHAARSQAGGF